MQQMKHVISLSREKKNNVVSTAPEIAFSSEEEVKITNQKPRKEKNI